MRTGRTREVEFNREGELAQLAVDHRPDRRRQLRIGRGEELGQRRTARTLQDPSIRQGNLHRAAGFRPADGALFGHVSQPLSEGILPLPGWSIRFGRPFACVQAESPRPGRNRAPAKRSEGCRLAPRSGREPQPAGAGRPACRRASRHQRRFALTWSPAARGVSRASPCPPADSIAPGPWRPGSHPGGRRACCAAPSAAARGRSAPRRRSCASPR